MPLMSGCPSNLTPSISKASRRAAEIDERYAAYDEHPLDEPDEWGDLASFSEAASSS